MTDIETLHKQSMKNWSTPGCKQDFLCIVGEA